MRCEQKTAGVMSETGSFRIEVCGKLVIELLETCELL